MDDNMKLPIAIFYRNLLGETIRYIRCEYPTSDRKYYCISYYNYEKNKTLECEMNWSKELASKRMYEKVKELEKDTFFVKYE